MKALEEKLPPNMFIRVHKSFIVALKKITSIRKGRISILKAQIPISEHFKANIYKLIDPKSVHQ
jgi:DNA-binding LytR/AlgR family response regulator